MNHKQTKVMLLGMDEITFMACLYVIDLRLRILVSEHRMDMTRRIWASTLANWLLVATVAGFDEFEIVSAEMGFFDYPCLGLLAEFSQKSQYIMNMIVSENIKWRFSQYWGVE